MPAVKKSRGRPQDRLILQLSKDLAVYTTGSTWSSQHGTSILYTDDISQLLSLVLNMKVKKPIDRESLLQVTEDVAKAKKEIAYKASGLRVANPAVTGPKTKGRPQDVVVLAFTDGYSITTSESESSWMIKLGNRLCYYSSLDELLPRLFEKKLMQVVKGPDVDSLLRDVNTVRDDILSALASLEQR
jgi:hypothetical protein